MRIKRVEDWIPHMQKLGVNAVYFSPVFESDTHGYNTRDYRKIDVRLGTNEDFVRRSATHCTEQGSGSCWTVCSIMWAEALPSSRM